MRRCLVAPLRNNFFPRNSKHLLCRRHSLLSPQSTTNSPTNGEVKHRTDPYTLLAPELSQLRGSLLNLLGSAHPGLNEIAQIYFLHPTKQLRPLLVLLFSRATNGLGDHWEQKKWAAERDEATGRSEELDRPLTRPDVLYDWHPKMRDDTASFESVFELQTPSISPLPGSIPTPPPTMAMDRSRGGNDMGTPSPNVLASSILPAQMRLAHIVEMIHVAALLHDDIIDKTDVDSEFEPEAAGLGFGNKLSILGGDFLLGRASAALSRLGESEVVELIASVISNRVEGEMLQLKDGKYGPANPKEGWDLYLRKTYLKTASLMASGARSAVILGGGRDTQLWKDVAYSYSRNLGMAYQLINDTLDYENEPTTLHRGLATGPVLYAWEENPDLKPLIHRNFSNDGDIQTAFDYVTKSSGIERTRVLANSYATKAKEATTSLPDSDTKDALQLLTERVVRRT